MLFNQTPSGHVISAELERQGTNRIAFPFRRDNILNKLKGLWSYDQPRRQLETEFFQQIYSLLYQVRTRKANSFTLIHEINSINSFASYLNLCFRVDLQIFRMIYLINGNIEQSFFFFNKD